MADIWRTSSGDAGYSIDFKQFFKDRVRLQRPNWRSQNECLARILASRHAACNINAVGCAMLRIIIFRDATALPHSRPRADKVERRGHMVDLSWQRVGTWRTKNGHMTRRPHKADTCRTNGRQGLEAGPKRIQGHKVETRRDTRRASFGGAATCIQGGHKADAAKAQSRRKEGGQWRTHGGQAPGTRPEHNAASLSLLRENPTVNGLGKKLPLYQHRPQTVFQA